MSSGSYVVDMYVDVFLLDLLSGRFRIAVRFQMVFAAFGTEEATYTEAFFQLQLEKTTIVYLHTYIIVCSSRIVHEAEDTCRLVVTRGLQEEWIPVVTGRKLRMCSPYFIMRSAMQMLFLVAYNEYVWSQGKRLLICTPWTIGHFTNTPYKISVVVMSIKTTVKP